MGRATLVSSDYQFPTAEAWLANHRALIELGESPIPPSTRQEYLLAERTGVLQRQWIPHERERRFLGLPPDFGKDPVAWDRAEKRNLLHTLNNDPAFLKALKSMLTGAPHG